MTDNKVRVYELDVDGDTFRDPTVEAMVTPFLEAHGINPKLFMQGTPITVLREPDGSHVLETWTAVDGYPMCETCPPGCVKRERVVVPLAAPLPAVTGVEMWPVGDLPEFVEPADPVAAAESAYRAALEEMAAVVARATNVVQRRREALLGARFAARGDAARPARPDPVSAGPGGAESEVQP